MLLRCSTRTFRSVASLPDAILNLASPLPSSTVSGSLCTADIAYSRTIEHPYNPCSRLGLLQAGSIPARPFSSSPALAPQPATNLREFRLAQTGEGIKECELVRWFVAVGDSVEEFGRVCEVQSDKATIEITSPFSGKVHALRHQPGDVVQVGDVLADILAGVSEQEDLKSSAHDPRVGAHEAPAPQSHRSNSSAGGEAPPLRQVSTVSASPAVRAVARELNVDLNAVRGTGPGGRVTKGDVLAHCDAPSPLAHRPAEERTEKTYSKQQSPVPSDLDGTQQRQQVVVRSDQPTLVPLRGYRRAMVRSMTLAATIPHFHFCDEVDVGAVTALRASVRDAPALAGAKLTYLPFFIKAAALALAEFPMLNSSLTTEGDSLMQHSVVNMGVAVATPLGLVVPNIKDVGARSIAEIAQELVRLQAAAVVNQLRPEDLAGGTFTLSNIGTVGGTYATPLVNPPEVSRRQGSVVHRASSVLEDMLYVVAKI